MGSSGISEETFRFSVVRNSRSLSSEELRDSAVRIVPANVGDDHPYFNAMLELRHKNATRETILAAAERLLAAPDFVSKLERLKTPIWQFTEKLQRLQKPRTTEVAALVTDVFGRSASDVVADTAFKADRAVVSDSLVLVSVTAPKTPGLRTRLMQARRSIAVIERLAEPGDQLSDAGTIKLLGATLLLPTTVFPLPDNNDKKRAANADSYAKRKAALEKATARAQHLLNDLSANTAAADDLSSVLSTHLFETLHQVDATATASLAVLPAAKVGALSTASKKIISRLGISEKMVDVPFVIDQLEKANLKLGHDLLSNYGDVLLDMDPIALSACGECKPVVLPTPKAPNDFTPDTRGVVELVGIQDLLIVRQKLREYRAGEIAHIENILQGEQKEKIHRTLDRTETSTIDEMEKEQEIRNDLETTDKYELQTEASKIIQDDRSVEAGVTITASYGPVNIEAHGNYASNTSTEESRASASTFARDVVSRSQQRIRERIFSRQTRTQITELEVTNRHQFDNTSGTRHVTGVYRWIDKFYEAQIVNYGKRTMLEFMIPEPSAFYKFAMAKRPRPSPDVPRPERPGFCRNGVFHPLSPADLQPENYLCFVGKYNVKNVGAPSPRYRRVSDVLKYKIDSTQGEPISFAESNDSFKVPEGYVPKGISYAIAGGNSHSATTRNSPHDDIILAVVAIGEQRVFRYYKNELGTVNGHDGWPDLTQVIEWGNPLSPVEQQFGGYSIGAIQGSFVLPSSSAGTAEPDIVKVSLTGHTTLPMSVSIQYSILCERSPSKFQQWQLDTFNAITSAYENLKVDYDDAEESRLDDEREGLQGRNPLLNRDIEKRELKKFSISLLTGQQYESFNAVADDYQTGIPQIDLADASAEGKFVRFFEQALEWRNMTYLFYPYFWGNKNRWVETLATEDVDPLFQQFLQAGFSRVWVPVRPGFEQVVLNYIECGGEPWTERDAPLVGDPDGASAPSVALIDEIKEQLGADFEFRPGTIAVRSASTVVIGTETDFRAADVDREILISLDTYRIAQVDEVTQQILLRAPYIGSDQDALGFAVGVKFVGEPWLVQVPTTLVHVSSVDPIHD